MCDGRNSVVRGCTIKANGKCFGYGGWCCFDAVFENNYGENLDGATNIDSLYNRNVTFRNNVLVNCQYVGILVNVGGGHGSSPPMWIHIDGKKIDFVNQNGMDGLYIYNNYVEMRDDAPFGAIQAQQKGLSNVVIRGNVLRTKSGHGRAGDRRARSRARRRLRQRLRAGHVLRHVPGRLVMAQQRGLARQPDEGP